MQNAYLSLLIKALTSYNRYKITLLFYSIFFNVELCFFLYFHFTVPLLKARKKTTGKRALTQVDNVKDT